MTDKNYRFGYLKEEFFDIMRRKKMADETYADRNIIRQKIRLTPGMMILSGDEIIEEDGVRYIIRKPLPSVNSYGILTEGLEPYQQEELDMINKPILLQQKPTDTICPYCGSQNSVAQKGWEKWRYHCCTCDKQF